MRRAGWWMVLAVGLAGCGREAPRATVTQPPSEKKPERVACVGTVEPAQGLLRVAASGFAGKPAIVGQLLVEKGDEVKRGQALARLRAMVELEAAVRQAEARVRLAESRVKQMEAPATAGVAGAAQTQVLRLEEEYAAARKEAERKQGLAARDLTPRVQAEAAALRVEQVKQMLAEARHRQEALEERRPVDVGVAKAEVEAARADLERARVELQMGTVYAPEAGKVTEIFARPGEAVGMAGLLELAPVGRMIVKAEVYESDVRRVRVGQKAKIDGASLGQTVEGTVGWISPKIVPRTSPTMDPTSYTDGRVFEVRIDVGEAGVLADRIHARVNVTIEP